ncbi:MAG: HI0074 family nucleotidyltransferase substrate-binding subunit [Clostridiales bacterium]|nr:HI0074 family nucleotidyltransferase substrate-binding subunit [Clostridiales bacterium]
MIVNELYNKISDIGKKYDANKIILYGSRARGDNRKNSDVDIAIFGMTKTEQSKFTEEINELPTLLDFDIVFVSDNTDENLLNNILKDGVVLMSKLSEKLQKFLQAIQRLSEAINEYDENATSTVRDGVIQRFEFCTELAWKATREYLLDQGYIEINSPKSVMKKAFAEGLITDENLWIDLINARNITSHIYDENTAVEIFTDIKERYASAFRSLADKLSCE